MNDFFIYLLKASTGIAIISIPYYLLMRKETNLMWKRIYLLTGLLASFLLPFFEFTLTLIPFRANPVFFLDLPNPNQSAAVDFNHVPINKPVRISTEIILGIAYITGMVFMLVRTFLSFLNWKSIKMSSQSENPNLFFSERNEVFAFFNFIHLPIIHKSSNERNSLLYHEQAHVRQLHFIDLLLAEFALLLTWFNPFTWLIIRMIKENHEHLADREVLSRGVNPALYRAHLLNQTLGVPVFSFGQAFNHSLTKKRFEMMKTKKSKRSGLVKLMVLVPMVLFSMSLLSLSSIREGKVTGKISFADSGEPAAGVSVVIKNSTTGTVSDIDGTFNLMVPGECKLVLSFVGYQTEVVDVKPGEKLDIKLEPKVYEIDMDNMPVEKIKATEMAINSEDEILYIVDGKKVDNVEKLKAEEIENVLVIKDRTEIATKYPEYKGYGALIEVITKSNAQKTPETKGTDEEVFYIVEEMPEFPGGLDALQKYIYLNLEYPEKAKQQKSEGKVMVKFNVNTRGEVDSPEIIQSSNPIFDSAALDVFREMPLWKPGKQRGKPVKVTFTVPVYFKLPKGN
jgi:TonB family protein